MVLQPHNYGQKMKRSSVVAERKRQQKKWPKDPKEIPEKKTKEANRSGPDEKA